MTDVTELRWWPTPKGNRVQMAYRPDSVDDPVISATAIADEYDLASLELQSGDVVLDVGAYIGSIGFALLADYPGIRVVFIEPLAENCAVLQATIDANDWGDVAWVYHNAASDEAGYTEVSYGTLDEGDAFMRSNRYVGAMQGYVRTAPLVSRVANVTLAGLCAQFGDIAFLKIDCEGCEYDFLHSPAIGLVREIRGEHHRGFDAIEALLGPTHEVTLLHATPDDEAFGLFRAVRR